MKCAINKKTCPVIFEHWTDTVRKACPIGQYECEDPWVDSTCIFLIQQKERRRNGKYKCRNGQYV